MRHNRIILLLVTAASVIPCVLLLVLGSRRSSRLKVHKSHGAHSGHGHMLDAGIAVAEPSEERRMWLYSLIGADFPGDPCCSGLLQLTTASF
jgi:hypothetical protein